MKFTKETKDLILEYAFVIDEKTISTPYYPTGLSVFDDSACPNEQGVYCVVAPGFSDSDSDDDGEN